MALMDYVVFEDNSSSPTPKSKSKKKPKKSIDKQKPNKPILINSVYEMTVEQLKVYFKNTKKIPKKDFNLSFKGKKTLLGSLLKENDIFIEVGVLHTEGMLSNKFISMGFKYVAKREITELSKKYVILNADRRVPLIVESKYMDLPEYNKHRDKIYKQFL